MTRRAVKTCVSSLAALGLVLSSLVAIVATATPAAADTKPEVHLKPNQEVVVNGASLPVGGAGAAYSFANGFYPDDCKNDGTAFAFCDYVPVRLYDTDNKPLSKQAIQSGRLFSVVYTLEWQTTNIDIPGNYPQPTSQYEMTIWDDPLVKDDDKIPCKADGPIINFYICTFVSGGASGGNPGGDEYYYDSGFLQSPEPELFGMEPKGNSYAVTVAHTFGVNTPYKLKVKFIESAHNPDDLSADAPIDLSAAAGPAISNSSAGGGGTFGTPLPGLAPAAGPGFDLGPATIGADTDLDALGGGSSLDLNPDVEKIIRGRSIRDLSPPGKASPGLMLLWLIALPLIAGGGVAVVFLRRRRELIRI
ncbi:MAG: hypothetical protein H0W70_10680 [Actinobacteria bacterium]|nr:hypothetical protein [Actinomycetota bacterium]